MGSTSPAVSRRGIITAVTAGTVLAAATSVTSATPAVSAAPAAADPGTGTGAAAALIDRDQLGTAVTKSPDGRQVTLRYAPDFHERLSDWLRFWWANAPANWIAPFEVHTAGTSPDGQAFLLTGITYTRADRRHSGFDARNRDAAYWATVASLFHHFPNVTLADTHLRVGDGHAGFTGSPEQVAFARTVLADIWQDTTADWQKAAGRAIRWSAGEGSVTSRSGWINFTRATLRRGLGTHL
ncbi:MAG TPA: hypothetical protein VFC19_39960 [Candidatus Limnocylindrales bacterium]|nr:hypothetical protein [Candidatus Limnocylindrales bacterium]